MVHDTPSASDTMQSSKMKPYHELVHMYAKFTMILHILMGTLGGEREHVPFDNYVALMCYQLNELNHVNKTFCHLTQSILNLTKKSERLSMIPSIIHMHDFRWKSG